MPSTYPTSLDSFPITRADATTMTTTHKDDHNNANDAINKIEAELGIDPSAAYATVLARLDALTSTLPATTQAGTTYTLALGDAGKALELTSATAVTVTVPPNSSVAFAAATVIVLCQIGAGQVTVAPGSGVTLRSPGSKLKTTSQYSTISLRRRNLDEWVLAGDLTA